MPRKGMGSKATQPIRTPTGLKYGQAKEVTDAQRQVPLPRQTPPPAAVSSPAADPLEVARSYTPPNIGLGRPTDFPDVPITSGLDTGPGPGSASISPLAINRPPNPDVLAMARYLPMLEALANRPTASATTRAFVRRLRSALPPDFEFEG